jgi:hypothetical protein
VVTPDLPSEDMMGDQTNIAASEFLSGTPPLPNIGLGEEDLQGTDTRISGASLEVYIILAL